MFFFSNFIQLNYCKNVIKQINQWQISYNHNIRKNNKYKIFEIFFCIKHYCDIKMRECHKS